MIALPRARAPTSRSGRRCARTMRASGMTAARRNAPVRSNRTRRDPAKSRGTSPNARSTAFPGRTSASTATPRPTEAKRPTDGANAARTTRSPQHREGGREHGLARELVEHQRVALVGEEEARRPRALPAARSGGPPQSSRRSIQRRGRQLPAPRSGRRRGRARARRTSGVMGVRKSIDHGRRTSWSKSWTYARRYSSRSRPVFNGHAIARTAYTASAIPKTTSAPSRLDARFSSHTRRRPNAVSFLVAMSVGGG